MKKGFKLFFLLLFAFALNFKSYSQYGTSLSFSTDKAIGLNFFYTQNDNSYYLGFSQQFNGQKNTVTKERKSNYGTTPIENGDYYWLLDLGYSRMIEEKFSVQPEISFGSKNYFTSYLDNRFSDNGYSLITSSKSILGVGLNLGYKINDFIEPYCGFHSIKKLTLGVKIHFDI
jgi:hypothetical protein